ncbi:patatin-like phospholipase family protein [Usitatibacter palustris]|uniref:NTE family protein n=1 Tax=Usitatibacter palustris TaxID=2732487 RepID=A0A6M4HA55_9PROT|nr:patatin-like phospholipase family protein [Usitatibacter palustris]QJR16669.1 hypothetical protein DSM104440_03505 [Usitatibacter palustris]
MCTATLGIADVAAQATPPAETASRPRPKIALVLSGGGARGLAHIGVLKVLRDQRVPVDMIVATSMGTIVGGAYAAGNTPEQMEVLVGQADWTAMFSDRPPREDLSFRRKEDDLRFIGKSELGVTKEGIVLPRGAFGSQNLEEFLRSVARPASDARHLDELPVVLRAVATDLETGELVVLRDTSLSVAMRASMSIPGAFAPTQVDGRLLGDGGLVRNLPVEVALELGADIIIAVNVGTPLMPRDSLSSAPGVALQMINILTEQNVGISLRALRPKDILISPDLKGVSFVDFERGTELIAIGEAAAKRVVERLAPLALDAREYARWEAGRVRRPVIPDLAIKEVRVEGAVRTNPEALKREVQSIAGVEPGKAVSDADLSRASSVLYGMGDFERVHVRSELEQGRRSVVIDVDEKPWGPNYLRIGGRAVADLDTDARFSITVQHTMTWVNSWGAEWRNEVQFGDVQRFTTAFYQPLGPGSPWFVEPLLEAVQSDYDIFTQGNRRTDRVTTATSVASAVIGRRLGTIAVARVGGGYERYRATPSIGRSLDGPVEGNARFVRASVIADTLDDANFPRHGAFVAAEVVRFDDYQTSRSPFRTSNVSVLLPLTFDRLTLLGIAGAQTSQDNRGGFSMGGFFNLSGTPYGAITGSQAALVGALAYYRMGELPRVLGRSWYLGTSLEAGNAWARSSDISFKDTKKAASVFVGLDSVIGPLYLGYGHTFGGDSSLYLFLGRPTERN